MVPKNDLKGMLVKSTSSVSVNTLNEIPREIKEKGQNQTRRYICRIRAKDAKEVKSESHLHLGSIYRQLSL